MVLFFPFIPFVAESHNQRNITGEVATVSSAYLRCHLHIELKHGFDWGYVT